MKIELKWSAEPKGGTEVVDTKEDLGLTDHEWNGLSTERQEEILKYHLNCLYEIYMVIDSYE